MVIWACKETLTGQRKESSSTAFMLLVKARYLGCRMLW